jgi:hypothetical protein
MSAPDAPASEFPANSSSRVNGPASGAAVCSFDPTNKSMECFIHAVGQNLGRASFFSGTNESVLFTFGDNSTDSQAPVTYPISQSFALSEDMLTTLRNKQAWIQIAAQGGCMCLHLTG